MKYLILIPLLLLTSCMTENTRTQLASSEAQIQGCWEKAVAYQHAALKNAPAIKSEVGALFFLSIVQQNSDKLFATCDDAFIALLNSHDRRYMANVSLGKTLGGIAIGAYAIDSIMGTALSNMGTSGDSWTVNGSRITSKSGNASGGGSANASSSGDGLGQANSFNRTGGNSQGISGFQPRTNPVQTDNIDANNPQSASGTNETAAPREGDAPEIPVTLPVEE